MFCHSGLPVPVCPGSVRSERLFSETCIEDLSLGRIPDLPKAFGIARMTNTLNLLTDSNYIPISPSSPHYVKFGFVPFLIER